MSSASTVPPAAAPRRVVPPRGLPRLIPADSPLGLTAHLDRYGPVIIAGEQLIAEVERAGLTGRGGAGFPAGRKLRAVAERANRGAAGARRSGAVVVANGAESEPASAKDRMLLSRAPHLVLDGIAAAADAVGATRGYLSVHSSDLALELAGLVRDRQRAGLDRIAVEVVTAPGGYVASQETALVNVLNGGPGKPTFAPPRPFEKGVRARPTLVANVETLGQVALIARFGADWFREVGGPGEGAGSALITVSGAVNRPGVYEIGLGLPLRDLLEQAGGPSEKPQAVLAGGYFGGWLPYEPALGIGVSDRALRAAGAALGPGVLVVLGESACGLAETAWIASYLASQSAGQCGPCSNGLPALAGTLRQIAFGRPDAKALRRADQLSGLVRGRGACHLPDGAAGFVTSALSVFSAELKRHRSAGPCPRARRRPTLPAPGYGTSPAGRSR
jgi:NADH:ubiquinone oxidoreductase subunit F (NADH-binding)